MAAIVKQLAPTNDTDANFRLWGKAISDILADGGWVKSADTGQIDWETVTRPLVNSQVMGYEIWKSNDATQENELHDIFVKIEYGGGSGDPKTTRIWVTVGWASDGVGNLTGIVSTRSMCPASNFTTTLYNCNLSAGQGWISIGMWATYSASGYIFSVERTMAVNNDGEASPQDEVLFILHEAYQTLKTQVINRATGVYPQEANFPYIKINMVNAIQSGEGGFMTAFGQKGAVTSPSINLIGAGLSTFGGVGTTVLVESYGVNHNYIHNGQYPLFMGENVVCYSRFE